MVKKTYNFKPKRNNFPDFTQVLSGRKIDEAREKGEKIYTIEKLKSIERNLPPFPEDKISEDDIEEFNKFG